MKHGTNAAVMRKRNEKMILSLINSRPISRAEIANITGLTRAAVTIIITELIEKGFILEEQTMQATVGRQPVLLSFNGKNLYTIGINIQRNAFFVGITNLNGEVIVEERFPIVPPEQFFECIRKIIEKQMAAAGIERKKIYGVGVATPGPIDVKERKILNPPNFDAWHGVSVAEELQKCLEYEVYCENVSSANALAEMYFGAAKGSDNFMTLLVDEGIGSGIVLKRRLFEGINELGHTSICYDGILCECGNKGCLEKYASMPAILAGTGYKSWKEAVDAEDIGLIEKEAEYLSTAIVNANNLFSLDLLILCGELCYSSEKLKTLICDKVSRSKLHNKKLRIKAGKIHSKSLIASAVVIHEFFSNE